MKEPLKLRDFGGYKMMLECGGVDDKYLFRQNLNKLPERIQKLMERRRLECIDSPKKPPPPPPIHDDKIQPNDDWHCDVEWYELQMEVQKKIEDVVLKDVGDTVPKIEMGRQSRLDKTREAIEKTANELTTGNKPQKLPFKPRIISL